MEKKEIFEILDSWNEWAGLKDTGLTRNAYVGRLEELLRGSNQVITITGPRRAGKSYIMRQMGRLLADKGMKRENILFVNFDDPRFLSLDNKLLARIYDTYREFMSPTGAPYIFLDEIQEISGWEKWVRMMHELKKARLIVSGSNAHLLSRELGTLLTGRHIDLSILPLSFTEFLMFNDVKVETSLDVQREKIRIMGLVRKYMENGSFPEVALSDKKTEILLNYFDDIVSKDIIRRSRVRKSEAMKALIKFYLSNAGNLMTFSSAARHLGITAATVEKFSGYLEDAYLVFQLKRFSFKVKEQEKSPRKIYAVDTGLCNTVGFRFSENTVRLAENIVYFALKRRQMLNPRLELFYWKDVHHREVDFVIKDGLDVVELIQVCWNMRDEKTKARELRSLKKAMRELKCENALIITEDAGGEEKLNGLSVKTAPLWEWLLREGGVGNS